MPEAAKRTMIVCSIAVGLLLLLVGLGGLIAPVVWPEQVQADAWAPWYVWAGAAGVGLALVMPTRIKAIVTFAVKTWRERQG